MVSGVLTIEVPNRERSPDHEMLDAHRQFARLWRLSRWRPIRCIKTYSFDGWRGSVAYELDWGEGGIHHAILKAFYHKLALGKPLTKLRYFVIHNNPGVKKGGLFRRTKREALRAAPVLRRHAIEIEVIPVQRVVKKSSRPEPNDPEHSGGS